MLRNRMDLHQKRIAVRYHPKEEPTLCKYGLENTNIDQLTAEYNDYITHEKSKQKRRELKAKIGFIPLLFTWVAPLIGVVYVLNLIFKWDVSKGTLIMGAVYVIVGTVYLLIWTKWAEEADKGKSGTFSLKSFSRKEEWEKLSQYKSDYKAYTDWKRKCNELFWEELSGLQFEEAVTKLYNGLGYKAIKTKASNDGGVDVVLYKDNEKIAIQCKAYGKKISPSVARELYGVLCTGDYSSGIIATVNGASNETYAFCSKCNDKPITIITVDDLIRMQKQA